MLRAGGYTGDVTVIPHAPRAAHEAAIEAAAGRSGPLFVLYVGSVAAGTGKSWCGDCVRAKPVIVEALNAIEASVYIHSVHYTLYTTVHHSSSSRSQHNSHAGATTLALCLRFSSFVVLAAHTTRANLCHEIIESSHRINLLSIFLRDQSAGLPRARVPHRARGLAQRRRSAFSAQEQVGQYLRRAGAGQGRVYSTAHRRARGRPDHGRSVAAGAHRGVNMCVCVLCTYSISSNVPYVRMYQSAWRRIFNDNAFSTG